MNSRNISRPFWIFLIGAPRLLSTKSRMLPVTLKVCQFPMSFDWRARWLSEAVHSGMPFKNAQTFFTKCLYDLHHILGVNIVRMHCFRLKKVLVQEGHIPIIKYHIYYQYTLGLPKFFGCSNSIMSYTETNLSAHPTPFNFSVRFLAICPKSQKAKICGLSHLPTLSI